MREKTRYRGVVRIGERTYEVRATWKSALDGKRRNMVREIEAPSAAAAAAKRLELRDQEIAAERSTPTSRLRLHEYAEAWLARKKPVLAPSTFDRYRRSVTEAILPRLGATYVDAIRPDDVARWRDGLSVDGATRWGRDADGEPVRLPGHPAGPRTVNGHLRVLRTLLGDACAELQLVDPSSRIATLPEPKASEANRLDAPELGAALKALRSLPLEWDVLVHTHAIAGARIGETTALARVDLELDAARIRVRRAVWRGRARDETKTGTERLLVIPADLVAKLRRHLAAMEPSAKDTPEVLERKRLQRESGLVFPNERGGYRSASWVREQLRRALEEAGIDRKVGTHGLRRTMNNLLRQTAGATVAKALIGHATEAMHEHYSHVDERERATAMRGVLRLVGGKAR